MASAATMQAEETFCCSSGSVIKVHNSVRVAMSHNLLNGGLDDACLGECNEERLFGPLPRLEYARQMPAVRLRVVDADVELSRRDWAVLVDVNCGTYAC